MRAATLLAIFLLPSISCDRADTKMEPRPAPFNEADHYEDRMTAHVIRSEVAAGEPTPRSEATSRSTTWAIKIAGRTYPFDENGLTSLSAAFLRFAETNRHAKPPQVCEIILTIRADPEAPYEVTRSLLERAAAAGFYRFSLSPSRTRLRPWSAAMRSPSTRSLPT